MGWELLPTGLGTEATLERLVYATLFTDARIADDQLPPDGTNDRRGWWADALEDAGENFGSSLWVTLAGIPTARELEEAIRSALVWLITEGIVSRIEVVAGIVNRRADVSIDLVLDSGQRIPIRYPDLWSSYG